MINFNDTFPTLLNYHDCWHEKEAAFLHSDFSHLDEQTFELKVIYSLIHIYLIHVFKSKLIFLIPTLKILKAQEKMLENLINICFLQKLLLKLSSLEKTPEKLPLK